MSSKNQKQRKEEQPRKEQPRKEAFSSSREPSQPFKDALWASEVLLSAIEHIQSRGW